MTVRNVLFIMADQMRADCWGAGLGLDGAKLETPALEALAGRGTVFERAYCPSPICGPSRMAFYTGLYATTHGATLNQAPLPAGTRTLGSRARTLGVRTALVGKTHMRADVEGMARLGLSPETDQGVWEAECGFDPVARHDGLYPLETAPDRSYVAWLRGLGYTGDNPWHDYANSAEGPDGEILSGWYLRNADKPARIDAAHSETAWTTDEAIRFIDEQGDDPWCLHVSYIKPHWPYIVPEPYCGMFGEETVWPATAPPGDPHPIHRAFMDLPESVGFRRPGARERVIPTYLALIRELDDHVGRLLDHLDAIGKTGETLIVFTSDHGDYLGDHGLGEKQLFHDESARIPLIVAHPDRPGGFVSQAAAEGVDIVPTALHALGAEPGEAQDLDGVSLIPLLGGGAPETWRDAACCELDYGNRTVCDALGQDRKRARGWMLRGPRWKYIHWLDRPDQLYDLADDPAETTDRAADPACAAPLREMKDRLFDRFAQRLTRCTMSRTQVAAEAADYDFGGRIKMGVW